MNHSIELQTAIQAVVKASHVCQEIRRSDACEDAISKKDRSPVTIADFGAQAVIIRELIKVFPDTKIVAEEDSAQMQSLKDSVLGAQMVEAVKREADDANWENITEWVAKGNFEGGAVGRFWTIDPIDGTKGFLRNQQYAVALSLVEDGKPVLGVLGCPNYPVSFTEENAETGMLFFAEKGCGAWKTSLAAEKFASAESIHVSEIASASEAVLCESVESGHSSHGESERIAKELGITRESLRIDSQCKYAAVAAGDASIYLRLPTSEAYREKIWDHGAGFAINEEAGGKITDVHGNDLDFSLGQTLANNQGIVVAPKSIHDEVIAAVKG